MSHKGCWKKYTQIFLIGILSYQPSDQSLPEYSRLPTEGIPIIVSLSYAKYHTPHLRVKPHTTHTTFFDQS